MSFINNFNFTMNSQTNDVVQNLNQLTITGNNNKIRIKSHIKKLTIFGWNNTIDGLYPSCLIENIYVNGNSNMFNLNRNCANVYKSISGFGNQILFSNVINNVINNVGNNNSGISINTIINNNNVNNCVNNQITYNDIFNALKQLQENQERINKELKNELDERKNLITQIKNNIEILDNNNNRNQIPSTNQNSNRYAIPNINQNSNRYLNQNINQNSNRYINPNINQNVNQRVNNPNQNVNSNIAQNSIHNSNVLFNDKNLSDFDKKKDNLFLEMDQFQYKHIQKYDSRRETECAICIEEFKRNDIIKEFYKCRHIFHKDCLKSWLKRSNVCPLCKHDLTEDINKMH